MNRKKIRQILMLLTCIAVMAGVAIRRDGKLLGHDLKATTEASDTKTAAVKDTMQVLSDGTIVINTLPLGKDITGFAGQVPLNIYLKNGVIDKVEAQPNHETPDFFEQASALLTKWNGKKTDEALALKVDGVSGATFSSRAIIGNMRAGLQYASQKAVMPTIFEKMDLSIKTIAGLLVVLLAAILPWFFKNKNYRTLQLILNVVVLGLWCGTFLSYSVFVNYMANGIDVWTSFIPIVMLITAFIYPLFGKKNYYCTYICPCGSMQDLAGKAKVKKWKMGAKTVKRLTFFRKALWTVLMLLMLAGVGFEWMDYEIFSAFIITSASTVVLLLACLFFILSVFVPRPYCRFICPTGTLFKVAQDSK